MSAPAVQSLTKHLGQPKESIEGKTRLLDARAAVGTQVGGLELHLDVRAGRAEVEETAACVLMGEAQRLEVGSDGAQAVVNGLEGDEGHR